MLKTETVQQSQKKPITGIKENIQKMTKKKVFYASFVVGKKEILCFWIKNMIVLMKRTIKAFLFSFCSYLFQIYLVEYLAVLLTIHLFNFFIEMQHK